MHLEIGKKEDFLTGNVIPVLGLIVAAVAVLKEQPMVATAVVVVVGISLLSKYANSLKGAIQRAFWKRKDNKIIHRAHQDLSAHVAMFQAFLLWNDSLPNFYAIVLKALNDEQAGRPEAVLQMSNCEALAQAHGILMDMVQEDDLTEREIRRCFRLFNGILDVYDAQQIVPIFRNGSEKLRTIISESNRSKLNDARERYNKFLEDYREFVRTTNSQLESEVMPTRAQRCQPL